MSAQLEHLTSTVRLRGAGVELSADIVGPDDAPPVLLLHGGGQTRHAWKKTAAALAAAGWQAIALDLRGHGDSDWPENGEYDPEHFAEDLKAVIETLRRPPAVVGASLGGMMALTAQRLTQAQLYRAAVLVDVVPRMERAGVERVVGFMLAHPDGFARLEEAAEAIAAYRPNKPRPKDLSGLERTLQKRTDGRWHWRWDIRFLTTKFRTSESGIEPVAGLESKRALMEERLLAGARKLAVPTLLVRGADSDVVSQEGAAAFLRAVPHAEMTDVAEAGHMVSGDQNDVFTAVVVRFLRGVASGRAIAST